MIDQERELQLVRRLSQVGDGEVSLPAHYVLELLRELDEAREARKALERYWLRVASLGEEEVGG